MSDGGLTHPGELVLREMQSRGWNQQTLAAILGWSTQYLSDIIRGRRGISARAAVDISEAFDMSALGWLQLDAEYRLAREMQKRER